MANKNHKSGREKRKTTVRHSNATRIRDLYVASGFRTWTKEEVWALCHYMHVTEAELCALMGWRKTKFVNTLSGPPSLLLEIIKRFYIEYATGKAQAPVMLPIALLFKKRQRPVK